MLHNITLLNRTTNITPPPRRTPLTIQPLLPTPPPRQNPLPLLRQIQEPLKSFSSLLNITAINTHRLAGKGILVFTAKPEAVDKLDEDVLLGEIVQVLVIAQAEQFVGDVEAGVVPGVGGETAC